jgi:hypothetical protein
MLNKYTFYIKDIALDKIYFLYLNNILVKMLVHCNMRGKKAIKFICISLLPNIIKTWPTFSLLISVTTLSLIVQCDCAMSTLICGTTSLV